MRYHRDLLALNDEDLERFVRDWIARKTSEFAEVERFSGAGDLGRDVVGFRTKDRHEGDWENFQCKQYGRTLQTSEALLELGKILHFASAGEFSLPMAYHFVVPRGMGRELERLIFNPTQLRAELVSRWDTACAKKIARGQNITLTPTLLATINAFDFSRVTRITVDGILDDVAAKPVLAKWFGADPGAPPRGIVPAEVDMREQSYLSQLVDAYGEREGAAFADHAAVASHGDHGPHLLDQRKRFFEADAFNRFYRDNTLEEDLEALHDEVYHGVVGSYRSSHADTLTRVDAVMDHAASVKPAGLLANHARVPVRQGFCHHFANDGRFVWKR